MQSEDEVEIYLFLCMCILSVANTFFVKFRNVNTICAHDDVEFRVTMDMYKNHIGKHRYNKHNVACALFLQYNARSRMYE